MLLRVLKFPRSSWSRLSLYHRPLLSSSVSPALSSSSCDPHLGICGVTTDVPQRSFHSSSVVQEVKKETNEEESVKDKQRKTSDEQKKTEDTFGKMGVKPIFYSVVVFVLGAISTPFLGSLFGDVKKVKNTLEDTKRFLTVQDIRESTVVIENPNFEKKYVHRQAVEKELNDFIEGNIKERYLIVYGAKGAGKSSVALKILSEKKGVALVKVKNYADQAQLSKMVAQAVMNTKQEVSADSDELYRILAKIMTDIANDKSADKGKYPTLVFEVERGGGDEDIRLIKNVRSLSKKFCTVANVIIILSEAIAVTTFGKDRRRERYMYVGDMTKEEAKQLLEKRGKHLNDTDFTYLYENIGGCPIDLDRFGTCDVSVRDFVREVRDEATRALAGFPRKHRQLLSLLKQHPKGVEFLDYPVDDMPQFGKDMKNSNVVYYDIAQGKFKLQSRALEVALKDFSLK